MQVHHRATAHYHPARHPCQQDGFLLSSVSGLWRMQSLSSIICWRPVLDIYWRPQNREMMCVWFPTTPAVLIMGREICWPSKPVGGGSLLQWGMPILECSNSLSDGTHWTERRRCFNFLRGRWTQPLIVCFWSEGNWSCWFLGLMLVIAVATGFKLTIIEVATFFRCNLCWVRRSHYRALNSFIVLTWRAYRGLVVVMMKNVRLYKDVVRTWCKTLSSGDASLSWERPWYAALDWVIRLVQHLLVCLEGYWTKSFPIQSEGSWIVALSTPCSHCLALEDLQDSCHCCCSVLETELGDEWEPAGWAESLARQIHEKLSFQLGFYSGLWLKCHWKLCRFDHCLGCKWEKLEQHLSSHHCWNQGLYWLNWAPIYYKDFLCSESKCTYNTKS